MTRVVVVGEALVDVVHRTDGSVEELPGGSPANVAITLGRLGRSPRLATCLGDDERGRTVRAWLGESDVEVLATPVGRTSTARAHLDADGAATYDFDLAWDLGAGVVPAGDVLHVGSIAALLEPGASAVLDAVRSAPGLVSYDPNARPTITPDRAAACARVEEIVALSGIVKVSDEDLAWLRPDEAPADVAARWSTIGPAVVVMTAGGDGSVIFRAGTEAARVPVPRVDVVDTVGAGDTYTGALLDGLVELDLTTVDALRAAPDAEIVAVCTHAAAAAAVTVSRAGANPPRRAELGRAVR
ncbi:fructokinase [Paraoerskovia marina]|uniref:Fructokinase n=1 Tax=Paraoerskovia marina TaxID=545619 RepID=A0A1H1MMP0_9CELL|nr:PfkB family carbohydrate kinase [Paraoerskovia marina]SDR88133.1 fructokinase [Paraoerskovia marina]